MLIIQHLNLLERRESPTTSSRRSLVFLQDTFNYSWILIVRCDAERLYYYKDGEWFWPLQPAVLLAGGQSAHSWNIHGNIKDPTCAVICRTSSEVRLESLDAFKWAFFLFARGGKVTERPPRATRAPSATLISPSLSSADPPEPPPLPKYLCFMYTSHLRSLQYTLRGGGGRGPLSQQRTTHHFLPSSLLLGLITESEHSTPAVLLVSQGGSCFFSIQFSPHNTEVSSTRSGWSQKTGERAEARLLVICVSKAIGGSQWRPCLRKISGRNVWKSPPAALTPHL